VPLAPTAKIWMDGELVDWDDAQVHVLTHSLHYGTGIFEGIRAYATAEGPGIFRLQDHLARLERSARVLFLELPYDRATLTKAVKQTVRASALPACYIRPLAYLGYGEMGISTITSRVHVAVAVWEWGAYLGDAAAEKGARVKVSSWARHDPRSMPTSAKATGMYINSSLAKVEAIRAGYDEALMLTTDGYVAECSGENVFFARNGKLFTPPVSVVSALEGVTRASVMSIAHDLGYEVTEQQFRRTELYLADEAFMTGTAAEIVPISSLDDCPIGDGKPGPVTRAVAETFRQAARGEIGQYKDWVEYLD
jgi:branched-chain amino acid aminotransferase